MAGLTFEALALEGAVLIRSTPAHDERGSFARTFDAEAFAGAGLPVTCVQESASRNLRTGTLRGLHGARQGHAEPKFVSCTAGRIVDVIVDARPGSPTFGRWLSVELDAGRDELLYVPPGFLHGFQTLADDTVVRYRMPVAYDPAAFFGAHYASPRLAIAWPREPSVLSERDAALAPFEPEKG
jgi:dTDP-4-dehydrorhamnose 3,5-epimerase